MSRQFVLSERSARAFREKVLMSPADSRRIRRGPPAVIDTSEFPLPFTIEWSGDDDAFAVWLPGNRYLVWNDTAIDLTTALSPATNKPTGWYLLDQFTIENNTNIYVVITVGATSISGAFANSASTATGTHSILVATAVCGEAGTATEGMNMVKQIVIGALILGGGGGSHTVTGTDGTSATVSNNLTFASGYDSNVTVSIVGDNNGNATATVNVYYK